MKSAVPVVVLLLSILIVCSQARSIGEDDNGGFWNFFSSVGDWFSDFFSKTPSEVGNSIADKARDASTYISESDVWQTVAGGVENVGNSLKDSADRLKDKSFSEIYNEAADNVRDAVY